MIIGQMFYWSTFWRSKRLFLVQLQHMSVYMLLASWSSELCKMFIWETIKTTWFSQCVISLVYAFNLITSHFSVESWFRFIKWCTAALGYYLHVFFEDSNCSYILWQHINYWATLQTWHSHKLEWIKRQMCGISIKGHSWSHQKR